jgi:hypothetical protein
VARFKLDADAPAKSDAKKAGQQVEKIRLN